jgi:hypothetical protein
MTGYQLWVFRPLVKKLFNGGYFGGVLHVCFSLLIWSVTDSELRNCGVFLFVDT